MRVSRWLAAPAAGLVLALSAAAAPASADVNQTMTAVVQGTSATSPTNGTLTIYSDVLSKHHTRTVQYFQHDGYNKTENLVSSLNKIGVVLKEEDIENACKSSTTDASLNPVGGYNIPCGGMLSNHPVSLPLGGDLIGRFCRKAQLPDTSPADCTADVVHVSEGPASGTGQYLQVGNKDHGAMLRIVYYTNVTGVDYLVTIVIPFGTVQLPHGAEVTKVILLPQGASPPHAVLTLN